MSDTEKYIRDTNPKLQSACPPEGKHSQATVIALGPCGCQVNGFNDKIGWHVEIAYCPTHAKAFKMKEVLKSVVDNFSDTIDPEVLIEWRKLLSEVSGDER